MIAESSGGGGSDGDGGEREALLRRRHAPAIRLRPVTPARSASGARRPLPAPRSPAVRAVRRPVLQLVADSGAFDSQGAGSRRGPMSTDSTSGVGRFWEPRPLAFGIALAAAVFVLVAIATFAIRTGQRNEEASTNAVSTTTVMSGVVPITTLETRIAIAPAAAPAAEIPVIDVKSLPAAPPAKRRR